MKARTSEIGIAMGILLLNAVSVRAQPYFRSGEDPLPADKAWQLVSDLSDEFEATGLDTLKWQKKPIGNDWYWIGRPPGLFLEQSVVVKDGRLQVTVGKLDSTTMVNGQKFKYKGGIVRSIRPGKVGWYYECKMKANQTVMSSTFWLMSKYHCEKKQELDIQECVGRTTEHTKDWAKGWDRIMHSNAIHRKTKCNPEPTQIQGRHNLEEENWRDFHVYGAWWKSPDEILFFLDGNYVYSIKPSVGFDRPAFLQMAIETYHWNPVPEDGGLVVKGDREARTTQYEWVRTWKVMD